MSLFIVVARMVDDECVSRGISGFVFCFVFFFFFKQKTAYEIVDCDWSSDVCSSDLVAIPCYKNVINSSTGTIEYENISIPEGSLVNFALDRKSVV